MTLTELQTAVYAITNRPDLVAKTLLAIQEATLKAHTEDYYTKDLFESGAIFDEELYVQQIEYKTLLPRWRSPKYFRKYDAENSIAISGDAGLFTKITPQGVFDDYYIERTNVWYSAGDVIHLKSNTTFTHILMGVYLFPEITEADFTSWIAVDFPFAIVYEAAATIFRQVGKTSESRDYIAMAGDRRRDVAKTGILDEGY